MIVAWILLMTCTMATLPDTTNASFDWNAWQTKQNQYWADYNANMAKQNLQRQQDLNERLERERVEREKKQAKYQKDLHDRLERERIEREEKQAKYQKDLHDRLERERIEREEKQAKHQKDLNERLERERIERERKQAEWQKGHDRKMKIHSLKMAGPTDCFQIENFPYEELYPDNNNQLGTIIIGGVDYVKTGKLKLEIKHTTYQCQDPPRYKEPFFKLVTESGGKSDDGKYSLGHSTNWKYYFANGQEFDWEPDVALLDAEEKKKEGEQPKKKGDEAPQETDEIKPRSKRTKRRAQEGEPEETPSGTTEGKRRVRRSKSRTSS